MTIKVGDRLPESTFMTMGEDGVPKPLKTAEVFGGKKVALFAVPGAYTGVCTKQHLPSYVQNYDKLKSQGFDLIACTSTNDILVLTQWGKDNGATGKIMMLADGNADFAKKVGLELDMTARIMGMRSKRYSMVVEDGVVKSLNVEATPASVEASGGAAMCSL